MAQNVTSLWNTNAATFNFDTTQQAGVSADFQDAYHGPDIEADLHQILTTIDETARPDASKVPPIKPVDPLLSTLENYPDNP